jgi:CubicO group peptidase (beta-lactamase class C family)
MHSTFSRSHERRSPAFAAIMAFSLAALASGCASEPPLSSVKQGDGAAEAWAAFDRYALAEMKARGITGMGVAVADSKGEIYAKGYGWADRAAKRPFDAGMTISNAGSVSKLFTCAAILRLAEEGRVILDAPVSAYLPEFRPPERFPGAREPTVRDLLTHHSGTPSDYLSGFMSSKAPAEGYPYSYRKNAELAGSLNPVTPPGTVFSYSNLSYGMLGQIVERASGEDFEEYCQREIFKPLKMDSASFVLKEGFEDRYAKGYLRGKVRRIPWIRDMPAGSLNLSARDLGRFSSAILAANGGRDGFLRASSVREALRKQNEGVALDADFSIGLTWWLLALPQLPGEKIAGHGGDLESFHALLAMIPERDLAVSILVNSANGIGSFDLAGTASEALRAAVAQKGGTQPEAQRGKPARLPVPDEAAKAMEGAWATPQGIMVIKPSGKELSIRAFGQKVRGFYREDGSLGIEARVLGIKIPIPMLEQMSLTREKFGDEEGMYIRFQGFPFAPARRAVKADPGEAWKSRIGDYRLAEPDAESMIQGFKLGFDKPTGLFCATVKMGGAWVTFPVTALSDSEIVPQGSGRNLGETISWVDGGLSYSGLRGVKK